MTGRLRVVTLSGEARIASTGPVSPDGQSPVAAYLIRQFQKADRPFYADPQNRLRFVRLLRAAQDRSR